MADPTRHAPKPVRDDTTLGKLLRKWEVPECDCDIETDPPWPTRLEERDNGIDPPTWEEVPQNPDRRGYTLVYVVFKGFRGFRIDPTMEKGRAWRPGHSMRCGCRHTRHMKPHCLGLDVWAAQMVAYDPEGYTRPPLPAAPTKTVRKERRLEVYERRAGRGEYIFHPCDIDPATLESGPMLSGRDEISVQMMPGKVQGGLRGEDDEDDDPGEVLPELDLETWRARRKAVRELTDAEKLPQDATSSTRKENSDGQGDGREVGV